MRNKNLKIMFLGQILVCKLQVFDNPDRSQKPNCVSTGRIASGYTKSATNRLMFANQFICNGVEDLLCGQVIIRHSRVIEYQGSQIWKVYRCYQCAQGSDYSLRIRYDRENLRDCDNHLRVTRTNWREQSCIQPTQQRLLSEEQFGRKTLPLATDHLPAFEEDFAAQPLPAALFAKNAT